MPIVEQLRPADADTELWRAGWARRDRLEDHHRRRPRIDHEVATAELGAEAVLGVRRQVGRRRQPARLDPLDRPEHVVERAARAEGEDGVVEADLDAGPDRGDRAEASGSAARLVEAAADEVECRDQVLVGEPALPVGVHRHGLRRRCAVPGLVRPGRART